MTRAVVKVKGVPKYLRDVVARRGRKVAVLHAALNARALETWCAMAAASPGISVIVTDSVSRASALLGRLLPLGKRDRSDGGVKIIATSKNRVIIVPFRTQPPVSMVDHVFVEGAQDAQTNPVAGVTVSKMGGDRWTFIVSGHPGQPGGWWDGFLSMAGVDRVDAPADAIIKEFPAEIDRALRPDDPSYARMMALDLSPSEEKDSIAIEAPHVFIRKRLKIRTDKKSDFLSPTQCREAEDQLGPRWERENASPIVTFELSGLQRRYLAERRIARMRGYRRILLLKPRRFGGTTVEQALSYRLAMARPHTQALTIAHRDDVTERLHAAMRLFVERDPRAIRMLSDRLRSLKLENYSSLLTATAGARGLARGDTLQKVHATEVAKYLPGPRQFSRVSDLMAGIAGAAKHGEVVAETTPDGMEWFGQTWRAAASGDTDWYRIFIPWFFDESNRAPQGSFNEEEILATLDDEESALRKKHDLTPAQIAWRRATKRTYRNLFAQEYPEDDETCFLTSGMPFFSIEIVKRLIDGLPEEWQKDHPLYGSRKSVAGGEEIVWETPQKGVEYVAGVDTSEGLPHSDPNGMTVYRRDNRRQVLDLHGRFRPRELAKHVCRIAKSYNEALTAVERNNHGHAVLQGIEDEGCGASHLIGGWLFHHASSIDVVRDGRGFKESDARAALPGWNTNEATRQLALDTLSEMLFQKTIEPRSRAFLGECLTFRKQSNGKYAADAGANDDHVLKNSFAGRMFYEHKGRVSIG